MEIAATASSGAVTSGVALVPGKTLEGAAACFGVCFLATLLFFPWPVALAAAAAATLAELFSRGWTDNLVMPLAAAAAMWLAGHFAHIPLS